MTSLNVSKMFAMRDKSLYAKYLHVLRFSISAIAIIAVMLFVNTENVYSQCPPGSTGPYTTTFNLCDDGCPVTVVWCCQQNPSTLTNSVHLVSFSYLCNPTLCPCVEMQPNNMYGHDIPTIPFDRLMTGLVNSGDGCFPGGPPSGMSDCDDGWTLQLQFSTGACYRFDNTFENWGYYRCDTTPGIAKCFESYEICYELVGGKYIIHTRPGVPVTPQFQCVGGCHSLCGIITY